MIKVADITEKLLLADGIALEALKRGYLNFSVYATNIQNQVEDLTKKPVKKGTIVASLARSAKKLSGKNSQSPIVKITDLSIKSSLCSITFDKTPDIERKVGILSPFQVNVGDVFMIVDGPSEVTLVVLFRAKEKVIGHFGTKPKAEVDNLAAVTVQTGDKVSGVQFALLSSLAAQDIEVLESVSTYLEISFVVFEQKAQEAIKALSVYLYKN
ncbi:MAG TPA: hypothetical protein VLE91_02960 [Candidatus Saccharimonadales bacterium]|nr:hypothetical protein [Candidatus Saccharimonadales bacterium]